MKSAIWLAIDRIGNRLAARMDWETVSGLPWVDIAPFLLAAPGKIAREIIDPDDHGIRLVVWEKSEKAVVLESPDFPAHRQSFERPRESVALFRPDMRKLSTALAPTFNFISRPAEQDGDIHKIGFVQAPGARNVDVALLLPRTPGSARHAAQCLLTRYTTREVLLLVPTARWLAVMPAFPNTFEVKVLAEFLAKEGSDSLISVVAAGAGKQSRIKARPAKVLQVRQDDRWEHLTATLNPSNGTLELRIEERSLSVRVWDTKEGEPSRDALILGRIAHKKPPSWAISDISPKNQEAMRRAFQRLQEKFKMWAPLPDEDPFYYEPATRTHFPRFTLQFKDSESR